MSEQLPALERPGRARNHWHVAVVVLCVVVAAILVVGGFFYRSYQTDITARRLCEVIYQIVDDQDRRLDGVAYYRDHPDELATAHENNRRILAKLDCATVPPVKTEEDQ